MTSTASAHVFINGRWSSRIVSFTLEVDKSPSAEDAVLLVKSTFLEFGDGLSLQERFRQIRKALTDPIFDKDTYIQLYEPGIDILDLREWTKKRQPEDTNSITEMNSEGERKSSTEPPQVEETASKAKAKPKTTVMFRNLPNNYTRSMLLNLLDGQVFGGKYDSSTCPSISTAKPTWAMPSSTLWKRRTWMNFGAPSMALGLGPFPLLRFAK